MSKPLLKADELTVAYGDQPAVFSDLDFSLDAGDYLGLSGPSGSGKTTLLRLCAGLYGLDHEPRLSGRLSYNEELSLIGPKPSDRLGYRRDSVSMITENPRAGLHPQRTVLHAWNYYGIKTDLTTALSRLGIADVDRIANAYPHELSGGEAQRVRLAFALAKKPTLLLLESPTAALDNENAQLVWHQVQAARQSGMGILHVDHNLRLLAQHAEHRLHLGAESLLDLPSVPSDITLGEEVLAAADVTISYGAFKAVDAINLSLRSGEFVALLGPSGAGKSSLGKALSGIQPAEGILKIEGSLAAFAKTPYAHVDTRVQYIWQEPRLSMNPKFSVSKTLNETVGARSITPEKLLELVGLSTHKLQQNTLTLSTGEQQRLAIARALAVVPKVLVCDEITSGLDTGRAQHILSMLHRLRKELGLAILFITHDEELAETHANRCLVMNNGGLESRS